MNNNRRKSIQLDLCRAPRVCGRQAQMITALTRQVGVQGVERRDIGLGIDIVQRAFYTRTTRNVKPRALKI